MESGDPRLRCENFGRDRRAPQVPPGSDLEFTIELVSVDSQAGLIGGLGGIFGLLAAAITANGLALTFTGHELREYLAGNV